jgi:hypothetical protein
MHQVAESTERTPINSATIGWLFFRVLRFGPILIGVFAGLFELMMRERAHRPRPRVLRDWL